MKSLMYLEITCRINFHEQFSAIVSFQKFFAYYCIREQRKI